MNDKANKGPASLGTGRLSALNAQVPSLSAGEVIGLLLSGLWLAGCILFFLVLGFGESDGAGLTQPLQFLMTLVAVIMPVAVIWVAVAALRSARIMRDESRRLSAAIDAMRTAYIQQQQGFTGTPAQASKVEQKLEEIAQVSRKTESALATFTSIRPGMPTLANPTPANPSPAIATAVDGPQAVADQTSLALGTPVEDLTPPLSVEDFIRALHFPETAEDADGFRALRRALDDRQVAGLVQAAQDVLTLLSQDGIYMDDLRPDRSRPEIWRKFAAGERGRSVAALGGVRDRSSLALTAGRMKQDPIFRDAAHHFLRRFDQTFAGFEKNASDADIAALADTRTARAFMLLGRVTGTFD
ncbi:hypothetical protein [Aliiroseovarius sediminis]|uniref:hypothetical protein n=1 Tax=Aliiroseovarius sediminis TaxID=2925839 RepID=UPI001F57CFE3|nr:hypothetical protein [Aliiroseovarius sediminis]MCI2395425.1 hypothetical protein [Aliiroseovarius sediminis]